MTGLLQPHALAEEVECFEDSVLVGCLVEADVAHILQQGEVDDAGSVLLVMQHQLVEAVVVLAGEGEGTVVLLDELDDLAHAVLRKTCLKVREVELANQAPRHGIAVKHRTVFGQSQAFEGVADGVAQVERLADAVFLGVLLHDVLLDLYGAAHHVFQLSIVGLFGVEGQQFVEVPGSTDEAVLQHFGIAGEEVVCIEAAQELRFEQYTIGGSEGTDFVLQPVEVDARLSAYRGIDHGQQSGGDVDVGDAALEGGGGKTAEVGHHTASQVDEERVARGTLLAQCLPYVGQRLQCLVHVFGSDDDFLCLPHGWDVLDLGKAQAVGVFVGQDEKPVGGTFFNGLRQVAFKLLAQYHFLFAHVVSAFFCGQR